MLLPSEPIIGSLLTLTPITHTHIAGGTGTRVSQCLKNYRHTWHKNEAFQTFALQCSAVECLWNSPAEHQTTNHQGPGERWSPRLVGAQGKTFIIIHYNKSFVIKMLLLVLIFSPLLSCCSPSLRCSDLAAARSWAQLCPETCRVVPSNKLLPFSRNNRHVGRGKSFGEKATTGFHHPIAQMSIS